MNKTYKIEKITWVDQGWYHGPAKAHGSISQMRGISIGIVLEEDMEWLSMSNEMFNQDGTHVFRHVLTFPKACILKREKVGTILSKGI